MSQKIDKQTADEIFSLGKIYWQERHYLEAIRYFLEVIKYSQRTDLHQDIAELTGGVYQIQRLTAGTNPVLSSDGHHLAYISNESGEWKVSISDIRDMITRRLAIRVTADTRLFFAPDGRYLFFSVNEDNNCRIYLATEEEEDARCIAFIEGYVYDLAISHESRRIAFTGNLSGKSMIYIIELPKPDIFKLETDARWNFAPQFSPDGSKMISIVKERDNDKDKGLFAVYDTAGGNLFYLDSGGHICLPFSISPDSRSIVFGGKHGLCNLSIDTSRKDYFYRNRNGRGVWSPIFSGEGKGIVFVSGEAKEDTVWILDLKTMERKSIFNSKIPLVWIELLSDCRKIVCFQRRSKYGFGLFLIDVDTKQSVLLLPDVPCGTRQVISQNSISFSSDGKKIFYAHKEGGDDSESDSVCYIDLKYKTISQESLSVRLNNLFSRERVTARRTEIVFKLADSFLRSLTIQVSQTNLEKDIRALQDFGSRYSGLEGCKRAGEFLYERFKRLGLETECDYYEHPEDKKFNSQNIIATLPGKANHEIIYVICAHYDSLENSPGAWDNASGVAAVLETARIMAKLHLGATIKFACFSGEELKNIGSRYFVRRAKSDALDIRGVLNNDSIGYCGNDRMEVCLCYTSSPLKNLLYSAADVYTELLTYSYKGTGHSDECSFVKVFGDIAILIQDYPYLPNFYIHGPGDVIELISLPKISEVVKLNISALTMMAICPSPVKNINIERTGQNGNLHIHWRHNSEKDIKGYRLYRGYYPAVFEQTQDLGYCNNYVFGGPSSGASYFISIKAYNEKGYESWGAEEINIAPLTQKDSTKRV